MSCCYVVVLFLCFWRPFSGVLVRCVVSKPSPTNVHGSGCFGLGQRWCCQDSCPFFLLIVDHATLPGPPKFLSSTWCTLDPLSITQDDVAAWPCSVDILLVFSSFLASLHWPQGASDSGKFGISYFELLVMFEVFSGYRLQKTVRSHFRSRRPLAFSGFFSWYRARNPTWLSVSP